MPTYRNDTPESISYGGLTFTPNKLVETTKVLSIIGLTRTSESPYYNPNVANEIVTFTEGHLTQSVTINTTSTKYINIRSVKTATISVYLRSSTNNPVPLCILYPNDELIEWEPDGNVDILVLVASVPGSCNVTQKKE